MYFRVAIIISAITLSGCSSWVFRYDVPQGNYLEKKAIEQLQVGMTKEQVKFILGSPVIVDSFNNDTWSYVYRLKSGKSKKFDRQQQLIIDFANDSLISASGDYALSDNFNTPFNEVEPTAENDAVAATLEEKETEKVIEKLRSEMTEQEIHAADKAEKAAKEAAEEVAEKAEDAI